MNGWQHTQSLEKEDMTQGSADWEGLCPESRDSTLKDLFELLLHDYVNHHVNCRKIENTTY